MTGKIRELAEKIGTALINAKEGQDGDMLLERILRAEMYQFAANCMKNAGRIATYMRWPLNLKDGRGKATNHDHPREAAGTCNAIFGTGCTNLTHCQMCAKLAASPSASAPSSEGVRASETQKRL